jgi:hypothetical protein
VRLHRYCERCHRIRRVQVSGHQLARAAARRGVLTGICDECSSFTCPRCGAVSQNPNDVREGYCGRCHDWTGR